jgi:hypothetical protein
MSPLAQLVDALLESTDPVVAVLDDVDLAPGPGDARMMLSAMLAPLEQLYDPRDLLVATAVLEAVVPMILRTNLLLAPQPAGRPV